jgi:AcrR family transcriptional regulator
MDNRERIIEGAAGLFRKYGIKSVTMDSLAGHLGISKRTIYENFSDKDELLKGVLKSMTEKQKDLLKRILEQSGNPIEAIFRLLEVNRDHFQGMSPVFQEDVKKFYLSMKDINDCDIPDYKNHQEVIDRGIADGYFRTDVDSNLANRCLYYLGRSIMDDELYPFDLFSRNEVIRNTFLNYLKGISTPKGLDLIKKLESNFNRISNQF